MRYIKYPRTPHLPWSRSVTADDIYSLDLGHFIGREVVVTEKMDGENTTLYTDHIHARSLDSQHHPSRDWVKRWHHTIAHEIPQGWRICGENMYAQHSIEYFELESYFYGFSLWNERNECLSWVETKEWFALLGISSPPILYQGIWDESYLRSLVLDTQKVEGYVVRLAASFHYEQFAQAVAKWVRPRHVQTDQHWMFAAVQPNHLRGEV